ncbi:MAG: threonine ammonia-lyase, biosynthetic [Gammaproteobacteria bacterium]|nr:threonine ammonia-lyase, biosynthetic [Gammaproteobacteria bacterium]
MTAHNFIEKVLTARVYDVAIETPLDYLPALSVRLKNNILLKREDLQPVHSFKLRGAYNKIYKLKQKNPELQGVITASAGNHAQGVAISATHLKIEATIVMPVITPDIKVEAVKSFGGKVILHGDNFDEAYAHSQVLAAEKNLTFIHPYDDEDVMAGQGTIAHEIIKQQPDTIDAIFVPVGGGGLLAGILNFMKAVRPEVKIIGVEPEDAACLDIALKAKRRVTLKEVGIFAEGVAVKQIGKNTYAMIKDLVDEVITVSTDQICAAIKDTYENTRAICEPAGAVGLAGLKKYVETNNITGQTLLSINSGANMNFDRLRHISERSEFGEQREAIIAVQIPERPGSFKQFCGIIGKRNITEFNYRYSDDKLAMVFAGLQLNKGIEEKDKIVEQLRNKNYPVYDMTDNELAKLHIRYMVGGHARTTLETERLIRFQFPEKPGALLNFLKQVGTRWNISMFHYRNHGSAFGRVLMGIQVDKPDIKEFKDFLATLEYPHWDESDNEAYQLFLK